uniref:Fucolectin tachylectin-4 pentraxin-1 domain-containing protein n=1 Tax=Oreochromis niloticus TaxID=8128 RepID=I3JM04_ORENI
LFSYVLIEPLQNVALNKQTVQSSTWNAVGIPFKGVDGCRTEFWGYSCCTHTSTQQNPWWRVDLLAVYKVTAVTIINRQDCCSERLLGAQILIGDSLEQNGNTNSRCGVMESLAGTSTYTFQCNGMEGRYINVIIPGSQKILTLCEVEVFASLPGYLFHNLALNQNAIQSSVGDSVGIAGKAVDGRRESRYQLGSCTLTKSESDPWWRVDLVNVYTIGAVIITNRAEVENGLDGAEIWIGKSAAINDVESMRCAVISHIPSGQTYYFPCSSMEGRYVTVFLPGSENVLSICEVEVYYGNHISA